MNSNNVLLTIIIPCYNSGKFLENTLNMLVSQGLENIEVIIINDGSTDNTKKIADKFAEKYLRFKVITHYEKGVSQGNTDNSALGSVKNRGLSAARNTGLHSAKGKYIYFFDSDDTLTDDTLNFLKNTILNNAKADIFVFGYDAITDGIKIKEYINKGQENNRLYNNFIDMYLSKKIPCHICSVIFSISYLKQNGIEFFKQRTTGEDIAFLILAFSFSNNIYYSNRICFRYQIRNDSIMQGYKKYGIFHTTGVLAVKKTIEYLIPKKPKYEKKLNFFLAMYYVYNLKSYLIAETPSNEKSDLINDIFIKNKYLLKKRMTGKIYLRCFILGVRVFPLKILFKLFRK